MKQFWKHLLKGYVQVKMTGYSSERFLNLCKNNGIEVWDVCCIEDGRRFQVFLPDYRRVRPLVRKSQVHLKIIKKRGLPFFVRRNRARAPFLVGFAAFFLILAAMTRFIWDISIEDNYYFTDDTLIHWLAGQGIVYGTLSQRIDCAALEERIRTDFPEILWVSARISGTRLLIRIKENNVVSEILQTDETPADLVAAADGVVTSVIVRQGIAKVKPGDTVKKGDLLVSGTVPIYNDAQELMATHRVKADADIVAQMECIVKKEIPGRIIERIYTGKSRYGVEMRIGNRVFVWMLPAARESLWSISSEKRQVTLFGDFYLPVWVSRIYAREYTAYERNLKNSEKEQARNLFYRQTCENFLEKGVVIIKNDVKILDTNASLELRGDLLVQGPIGILHKMTEAEGEDMAE